MSKYKMILKDSENVTWKFVLNKRKNYYDEYVVKTYKNGKYYENATYYTTDWDDAVATLKFEAKRQGLTITVDTPTRVVAESTQNIKDSVDGTLQDKDFVNYLTSTSGLWHLYEEGAKEFRGPSGEYTYLKGMTDDFGGDTNTIRTYDEDGTPLIIANSVKDYFYKFAELSGSDSEDEDYQYYLEWLEDK